MLTLTLIGALFTVVHNQEIVVPLKNIFNALHREPVNTDENSSKIEQTVQELWLEQPLDHFENGGSPKWQMRYMMNDKFYQPGGPMFIFVGGEWEISEAFLLSGHMYDMARKHGGMLYYTEHRYYGKSWPTINTTKASLAYLNSRQALADLALFIKQQNAFHRGFKHSAVILTGGSYSGSLVSWFSKIYPQLATAAWASSAPIFAKADFYEYLERVGFAIVTLGGSKCYHRLQNGIEALHRHLTGSQGQHLMDALKLCRGFDVTNALDVAAFFNSIGNYFAAIVQSYSYSIQPTCAYLMSLEPDDDLAALTKFLSSIFWPALDPHEDWCIDLSYSAYKQLFSQTEDYSSGARPWFYQTCNEFGWYTTSSSSPAPSLLHSHSHSSPPHQQLFGPHFNLTFFVQLCADVFGPRHTAAYLEQNIVLTNNLYVTDGLQQIYENVIMTHGQLDPWRAVGLERDRNVFVIPGVSHTADLGSINVNDSIAMNLTKIRVASFVRGHIWRSHHYNKNVTVNNK